MTLQPRDQMPMFRVADRINGAAVDYEAIWQHRNLLLVSLRADDETRDAYVNAIAGSADLRAPDTSVVITTDRLSGIPQPGVVIADRWGEIYYVAAAARAAELPTPDALVDWIEHVRHECPECQGETR